MTKETNKKNKMWYLLRILQEKTDEKHPMQMKRLLEELEAYEITAERKSVYDDMNQLKLLGYEIAYAPSRKNGGYYLASREFELPELKLLVDAVQASRFITVKKSRELIGKLEGLTSSHEAKKLQRQVYVAARVKAENEGIYRNVDTIHEAMQENRQISFQYLEWSLGKNLVPKKDGSRYQVSPWALLWQEENYYLVAYDSEAGIMKHYRVDKMGRLLISREMRDGSDQFAHMDVAAYANKTFGMFGGREEAVTLQFPNGLIGVVMDRFGREVTVRKRDDENFSVRVPVAVSRQFFGWLCGLSPKVRILGPENVVNAYKAYLDALRANYD